MENFSPFEDAAEWQGAVYTPQRPSMRPLCAGIPQTPWLASPVLCAIASMCARACAQPHLALRVCMQETTSISTKAIGESELGGKGGSGGCRPFRVLEGIFISPGESRRRTSDVHATLSSDVILPDNLRSLSQRQGSNAMSALQGSPRLFRAPACELYRFIWAKLCH